MKASNCQEDVPGGTGGRAKAGSDPRMMCWLPLLPHLWDGTQHSSPSAVGECAMVHAN